MTPSRFQLWAIKFGNNTVTREVWGVFQTRLILKAKGRCVVSSVPKFLSTIKCAQKVWETVTNCMVIKLQPIRPNCDTVDRRPHHLPWANNFATRMLTASGRITVGPRGSGPPERPGGPAKHLFWEGSRVIKGPVKLQDDHPSTYGCFIAICKCFLYCNCNRKTFWSPDDLEGSWRPQKIF